MQNGNRHIIFLLDKNEAILNRLAHHLSSRSDLLVRKFSHAAELMAKLDHHPDIVVMEFHLEDESGEEVSSYELLQNIKAKNRHIQVIAMVEENSTPTAIEAFKAGAYDYLVKDENAETQLDSLIDHVMHLVKARKAYTKTRLYGLVALMIIIIINLYLIFHGWGWG